ncbi:hypothetical protein OCC_08490 [Thermococcus litoralis DSM 5473]|uniref:DUF2226 domain-containing protein n=2 Tax=Thermococcus litoralis TaxID=2265 RepID=H3ZKS8_THELN|nr:hypothetical protein OCC_08490 [Thermococcus litoralis DSM 5473]
MQLPNITPLEENIVCTKKQELLDLIYNAFSNQEFSGLFLKMFTKDEKEKYYATILLDRKKLLAAQIDLLNSKKKLIGSDSVETLKRIIDYPLVVDLYGLDEISLKLSITDNLEIYNSTPKVELEKIFGENKIESAEVLEKEKLLEKALERKKEEAKTEPQVKVQEEIKKEAPPKKEEKPLEKAPKIEKKPSAPEIDVKVVGGEIFKPVLQEYAEEILKEIKNLNGVSVERVGITGEVGSGVIYLHVNIHGTSERDKSSREILERRVLYFANKHLPIIWRKAGLKPILSNAQAKITAPGESEEEKEEKKEVVIPRKVESNIIVEAHESVKPYFSTYARVIFKDIQSAGIDIDKMLLDIKGRSEHEINLTLWGKASGVSKEEAERIVNRILRTHAREIGKALNKYVTVHRVELHLEEEEVSSKAKQIMSKKEELEKEIEKLLKEAGVEELSYITEEKKKEAEEALLKSKVEPAIEELRKRLQREFTELPNSVFRWMNLDWEFKNGTVLVDLEASFDKRSTLLGIVSDERVREDITRTLEKVTKEVSAEHNIPIKLRNTEIRIR